MGAGEYGDQGCFSLSTWISWKGQREHVLHEQRIEAKASFVSHPDPPPAVSKIIKKKHTESLHLPYSMQPFQCRWRTRADDGSGPGIHTHMHSISRPFLVWSVESNSSFQRPHARYREDWIHYSIAFHLSCKKTVSVGTGHGHEMWSARLPDPFLYTNAFLYYLGSKTCLHKRYNVFFVGQKSFQCAKEIHGF